MDRRKFVRTSGGYIMLLPLVKTWGNHSFSGWLGNDSQLKKECIAAFNRFSKVWDFTDFWKRGNTMDACINFIDALLYKWPHDPEIKSIRQKVDAMLEKDYIYFKGINPNSLWADDFGWWGLMGLNARKHLLRSGNNGLADKYQQLSTDVCWKQARSHAYDFSTTAKPVPHGWSNGPANDSNKGVKNTVTNVLYFLLSVRIYRLLKAENNGDKERYLDMAYRQWVWFDSWFQLKKYDYLRRTLSGGALVQERPTAFFDGSDYADREHPTWEKGWLWAGDQGMVLAALSDMMSIKNDLAAWMTKNKIEEIFDVDVFEKKVIHYIALISKAIKTTLISNKDHIIREAPFNSNFGPEFGDDYLAGRGIMMRYLGKLDKKITGVSFKNNIEATANAIWQTRDKSNNQFQPAFTSIANDKLFIKQFKEQWGIADDIYTWHLATMNEQQKFGVCQSIGLDALGATIRVM